MTASEIPTSDETARDDEMANDDDVSIVPIEACLRLPEWIPDFLRSRVSRDLSEVSARMDLILEMATLHVSEGTGGPFAAGVFSMSNHRLVAVGVNLVMPAATPVAHAEVVAFTMAGQALGSFDLSASGPTELVSSTEPCAMCLGAVQWSGVRRLVCGASDADARSIGFDEGHKPDDWVAGLEARGVEVLQGVRRDAAAKVLRGYVSEGGHVYNAGGQADA